MTITRAHGSGRMSQIVVHGGVVYLAGQVPNDFSAPVREQTEQILGKIDSLLNEAGSSKSRLLTAQIMLADITDFEAMNAVWDAWVDNDNAPARATFGAPLAHPDIRVEIIVTAASS